jgi:integrase
MTTRSTSRTVITEATPPNRTCPRKRGHSIPAAKHRLRWHDLRHTCASLSLAVAPNLHVVKERLGHEDIRTTINVYGHLLPSVDQALADGLSSLFDEAAGRQPEGLSTAVS